MSNIDAWCLSQGIVSQSDLAYFFESYEEALAEAGEAVAQAWLSARTEAQRGHAGLLLDLYARQPPEATPEVLKAAPKAMPKPSRAPAVAARPALPQEAGMPRKRGLPAATPLIERNAKFKEVFVAAMKLGSRYSELFSTTPRVDVSMVPRLVDQVLGAHEEETLSRVAKTWQELALWADAHNLIVGKMSAVEVAAFVENSSAPARILSAMQFLVKRLQAFPKWMNQQEYPMDGECGPQILDRSGVMLQRAASQAQSGAAARKSSIAPLVSFGLSPDEHFAAASFCQVSGSPLTWPPPLDCDLHFAAHCMAQGPDAVSNFRHENLCVFEELSRRLWPISEFLHSTQLPEVFGVNPKVHLCLIAVLVVLFAWPDTTFPHLLRVGFPAVGWIPPCGLWDSRPSPFMHFREAFHGSDHEAEELLSGLRPSADDQVAAESGQADELAGFCTAPMSIDELRRHQRPFRLIRRFVITQSSGKKRVIDDACAGGQSRLSKDCNRLRFCSAVHPCLHIQALHKHIGRSPCDWPDTVSSKIPMDPDHTWACIVVSRCLQTGKAEFRRYHCMLFGLPLAVTAFNRLPFFLQAVLRRTLAALCSFCFDDLTSQDWTSCAVHTQKAIQHVCELLGYPFATEKQQPPCLTNDFLGLVHDLSAVRSHGLIRLWIRPRLATKIQDIMSQALDSGTLLPGQASKLYGCLTFLDQGTFGHVARAGLNSIKERQYSSERCLTAELQRAFNMIDAIFELQPRRVVELHPSLSGHLLAASDASQDAPRQGNAGVLLQTAYGFRCGTVITIDSAIFDLWSDHPTKIAQLELLAIVQGILAFPELFRSSSVVWYIDNVAALMSLVRGRSDNAELDFMSQLVHLLLFHLHCHSYWEWIQSKSNWADGISREGFRDPWLLAHGCSIRRSSVPVYLWALPFRALCRVCAFQCVGKGSSALGFESHSL